MTKLIKFVQKKINNLILCLSFVGVIMLMLAVLITWSEFLFRLLVGFSMCFIAFIFFMTAYKIYDFKREVEKHLKIKK